jgi:LytS/YehU family sensor histidine kinase
MATGLMCHLYAGTTLMIKKLHRCCWLPFVENAYKHGPSQQLDLCWISFDLAVEDNMIRFKLINSFDADEGIKKEVNNGGMGSKT